MWAYELDGARAGLAWDWFELRPRVVALADPMNVLSNLEFVDAEGRPLSRGQRLVELNNIIASLPWQCGQASTSSADTVAAQRCNAGSFSATFSAESLTRSST